MPRTLPIRLPPLPGEALDSWLGAIMHRSSINLRDLLIAAGPPFPARTDHTPDYTTYLTAEEADRLSHITGTDTRLLHAMTLRRYDGYALALHDTRRVVRRVRLWGRGIGSRYCPRCLAEGAGRWPLRWRLTWSIACTRHQVLLAHACPVCGRWPHRRPSISHQVNLHECSARADNGRACRADLTQSETIPLPPDSMVLDAQEWINGLLSRIEVGDDDPYLHDAFTDVTAIAARSLLRAEPGDFTDCGPQIEQARQRHGNSALYAPVDAAVIAGPVTVAVGIVRSPLAEAAFAAIRTLVDREVAVMPKGPTEQIRRGITRLASANLEQQFWRAADPHLATGPRLRYRTCTARPSVPKRRDHTVIMRTHSLPQLLWPDWALLLFPPQTNLAGRYNYHFWRAALAAAVMLPGWWQQRYDLATSLLHGNRPLPLGQLLPKLAPADTDLPTAICLLAEYLDQHPAPIDYARRRKLKGNDLLPEAIWIDIRHRTGTPPDDQYRLPAVRRYLYQRMTGSDLYSPSGSLNLDSAGKTQNLPIILTPSLLAALDEHAAHYLTSHGIHEPVTWSPPLALVDHLDLSGRDMPLPDTEHASKLIRSHLSPPAAASALGTSLEHLRNAFEPRNPAPGPWPRRRPARRERVEKPVPRDTAITPSDEVSARPSDGATAKRTPVQALREARTRDSEIKRGRVLKTLDEMVAAGVKITFLGLARTARVSNWLVYAEGLRERIEEAIEKQGRGVREVEVGSGASAESLAADLELAIAELRTLRAERDRLKAGMARLRETEAERDRLREALKESEEKLRRRWACATCPPRPGV
ncbi:TniQ family protein [Streptomyces europaeiscabiei]|uniref:TniQ family protein n=1 Tax=Streptomyces europaeiscabiei TaxID=146819 RepID=UPI001F08B826|nr:TniQ family protein [Streptomyces europaeiscabiei]